MTMLAKSHERRAHQRLRCLKGARIILANGNSTLACRVRSQSDTGLKLAVDEPGIVPGRFTLMRDGGKTGQMCKIVWRNENEIGVRVLAPVDTRHEGLSKTLSSIQLAKQHIVNRYPV